MNNFKKIKYEEIENAKLLFSFGNNLFDEAVNEYLFSEINKFAFGLLESTVDCESPIEQIMAIALEHLNKDFNMCCGGEIFNFNCLVTNQRNIEINNLKYRVDFLIDYFIEYKNEIVCSGKMAIECDGFDYHHKTKEQVLHDLNRDREFMKCKIDTMHFLGTEIVTNVDKCVSEIKDFLKSKITPIEYTESE